MSSSLLGPPAASPHGGSVDGRLALFERFESRLNIHLGLSRKVVSYQANKGLPGLRWLKYKEAFSRDLVDSFLDQIQPESVLDPFAGIGTTCLAASSKGISSTGIEIMPVGVMMARAVTTAANGLNVTDFQNASKEALSTVEDSYPSSSANGFPHVPITDGAFPSETDAQLGRLRHHINHVPQDDVRLMMEAAALSVLESVSYTRKDGQYLRWDHRSTRKLRGHVNKGPILDLDDALSRRFQEMEEDIAPLKDSYGNNEPTFIEGSSLYRLRELPAGSYDMVMTSPPYANRYDYTRTYALELAWLGYGQSGFSHLRQEMLSATVENKPKLERLQAIYRDSKAIQIASELYENDEAIREILGILRLHSNRLSNPHVIRLIEGYFFEMALIIFELARVVRTGGTVIMVNDNVQYHGEEVPVDLILSEFAESCGFRCEKILILPTGKGNSSQQMGRFGRRQLRKCVYWWTRV